MIDRRSVAVNAALPVCVAVVSWHRISGQEFDALDAQREGDAVYRDCKAVAEADRKKELESVGLVQPGSASAF